MDDSRPSAWRLTKRELECAQFIALAYSNSEIGRRMSIGTKSVENLINGISLKMELRQNKRIDLRVMMARWVWLHPHQTSFHQTSFHTLLMGMPPTSN